MGGFTIKCGDCGAEQTYPSKTVEKIAINPDYDGQVTVECDCGNVEKVD